MVRAWLASRDEDGLFVSSVRQNPSLADIVKMLHPKPENARRKAFYGYMLGRPDETDALPKLLTQFEQFKAGKWEEVIGLPHTMLSAWPLSQKN